MNANSKVAKQGWTRRPRRARVDAAPPPHFHNLWKKNVPPGVDEARPPKRATSELGLNLVPARSLPAFSLVEVALALGIMGFCAVALIGLIPVGLCSQQAATEQTKAVLALDAMASCIRGMACDSQGNCRLMLPLPDAPELDFVPGGGPCTFSCGFTGAGTFCKEDDFNRCGTIYMKLSPPATTIETGSAYLSAAWPGAAVHDRNGWTRHLGFVETVIYFNLPQAD